MALKYKVGDKVRIKNLDWYNENKDEDGVVEFSTRIFVPEMMEYCGMIVTIKDAFEDIDDNVVYYMEDIVWDWTDEMIEGLAEEENNDCEKCGLTHNSVKCLFMNNCPHNKQKNIIEIPESYVLKDENGNVINVTKIVLEKKKKEYPKTYEECCEVLSLGEDSRLYTKGYKASLIQAFQKLLICRDAYWKLYGEEMGLEKLWEPDWNNISNKYCIYFVSGDVWSKECQTRQCPFAFPTPEMRDAFYENFKSEIEICKKLL